MDRVRTSDRITRNNDIFYEHVQRLQAIIFSSKYRKLIFGQKDQATIDDFINRFETLQARYSHHTKKVLEYNDKMGKSKAFKQDHQHETAVRYTNRARSNSTDISRSIAKIIFELKILRKGGDNPKSIFHGIRKRLERIIGMLHENRALLSDVQGRAQLERRILTSVARLQRYRIDEHSIQSCDLLVSFKTDEYLKGISHFDSIGIAKFTNSQITHVAMAIRTDPLTVKFVDAYRKQGVRMKEYYVRKNTVDIIMRAQLTHAQRAQIIDTFRDHRAKKTPFSTLKIFGMLPTLMVRAVLDKMSNKYLHFPNVFVMRRNAIFCAEILDQAFKDAGVYLTPKSKYSSSVFPADIAASPHLKFIGLIFEDEETTQEEIKEYFEEVTV